MNTNTHMTTTMMSESEQRLLDSRLDAPVTHQTEMTSTETTATATTTTVTATSAHNHYLGTCGEDYACQYLTDMGWTILDRNWHCRFGEVDIVAIQPPSPAQNSSHSILVFLEVKTRSSLEFGDPLESITPRKCMHLRKTAVMWLAQHHLSSPVVVRFDAIGILTHHHQVTQLTHVRRIMS